jgi:LysM repeat protein
MTSERHKYILLLLTFLPLALFSQNTAFDEAVKKYIATYHKIAVEEMVIFKIPASITLAQGIFESNAGRSNLATIANNHFGIKCHKEWKGPTFIQDDETKNECFRKYDNPEESFRDHSSFLTQRDRYKPLFLLDITDYKAWAKGLKQAGYATNPKYADLLIKQIETYALYRFDDPMYTRAFEDSVARLIPVVAQTVEKKKEFEVLRPGPAKHMVYGINGLQLTLALKGDTWKSLAKLFYLSEKKLLKFNDLKKGAKLVPGQLVFLETKAKTGSVNHYVVREGETMYTISQQNGIQLKLLYKMNTIKPGTQLRAGQELILR